MFGSIVGKLIHHGVQTVVHYPRVVGAVGERRVEWELSRLPSEYVVLHDLLLPRRNGETSQIDHVVVSPYGIFVVESKNYHGMVYGRGNEKYWVHESGAERHQMYNPIWQNHGHIEVLRDWLGDEEPSVYVNLVVFGNGARLDIQAREKVWYVNELLDAIESYRHVRMGQDEVTQIVERLNELRRTGFGERARHRRRVKEHIGTRER
ncbi:NERD domain-containing protein [Alicyclobacillus tolerans]|uniref:nuclease-related domain-containing protein n=1 Tax=Alicyclobacillus tolerans TaxID=90970 RepID=UPI001F443D08|nr:nuclease-related domain-containing protein [Alicyclobacillus tolerans]MCF8568231.1 NERD domain-containing protein [Alicyclobacillus tolerans]